MIGSTINSFARITDLEHPRTSVTLTVVTKKHQIHSCCKEDFKACEIAPLLALI